MERNSRGAMDFADPALRPGLHERIGDLTGGDSGLEDYRLALEGYEACDAPVDDQLRALAGMLMVATRWSGSVGDRPTEEWMDALRERGRRLLPRAGEPRSIGRFLAADAFYPFWIQNLRQPTAEELALADADGNRALQIAIEHDDPDLASVALDAISGTAQATSPVGRSSGYCTLGRPISQSRSSVRQKASGAKLASCPITSGVCVDGSRLTRPVIRQAARPTVKRYRSAHTLST